MKLRIRWKLLILLLAVSLLPLSVVCVVVAINALDNGTEVAEEVRGQLVSAARYELQRIIQVRAETLDVTNQFIQLILLQQAGEVEKRLAQIPPTQHPDVWTAEQFDAGDPPPPGLIDSRDHERLNDDGTRTPMKVSFQTQVMRLAPDVDAQHVANDAARLADMTSVYRNLRDAFPMPILWQFTSLANGAHFSYPGKGGYPADYDPRKRVWFKLTLEADGPRWFPPTIDVTTGQLVLTIATPLRLPDGKFAGVTAIDVAITAILGTSEIQAEWAPYAQQDLMVMLEPAVCRLMGLKVEGDQPQPVIFARSNPDQRGGDWRQPAQLQLLSCDDPTVLAAVYDDFTKLKGGLREVSVKGKQYLWAYGLINSENPGFILISVPYDSIVADADAMQDRILQQLWRSLRAIGWIALAAVAVVLLTTWGASRTFTKPIRRLAEASRKVSEGDLETRVELPLRMRDEMNELADAFNAMVPGLRDRVQLRESLTLAMQVQQSLLPEAPPKIEGLDIAGHSQYCDETGGDYYDFIELKELDHAHLGVAIGDVAGHGISAALLMATARALLRSRVDMAGSLAQIFADVNRHLCTGHFTGRFMTLYYLVIDIAQRRLSWVSAGHDAACLYDPTTDRFEELEGSDIPLGVEANWPFHEYHREGWVPGQTLFMGTDGIWEARNPAGEMFGKQRLLELLRRNARSSASQIDAAIRQGLVEFRGEREQLDDITLVVIKFA